MPITHTLEYQWRSSNGSNDTQPVTKSGDGETILQLAIADGVTDQLVTIAIDLSELESLYILSDQAVTIETNNGAAPADTFSMLADTPLVWHSTDYHANPLSVDVAALYITNASGSTANIDIRVLQDTTP